MKKLILALVLFSSSVVAQTTYPFSVSIVPRTDQGADVGQTFKKWDSAHVNYLLLYRNLFVTGTTTLDTMLSSGNILLDPTGNVIVGAADTLILGGSVSDYSAAWDLYSYGLIGARAGIYAGAPDLATGGFRIYTSSDAYYGQLTRATGYTGSSSFQLPALAASTYTLVATTGNQAVTDGGDYTVDALTVGQGATVGLNLSVSGLAYVDSILNLVGPVTVDDTLNVLKLVSLSGNLDMNSNDILEADSIHARKIYLVGPSEVTTDADLTFTSATGSGQGVFFNDYVSFSFDGQNADAEASSITWNGNLANGLFFNFTGDNISQWGFHINRYSGQSFALYNYDLSTYAFTIDSTNNDFALSGNLEWQTDNSKDIGASGANRPRDIFVADDVVAGGDFSTESDVIVTADNGMRAGTSDGSDNSSVKVTGGGGFSTTQGGTDAWYGNEHATLPGVRQITSGNVAGSYIQLSPKGTEVLRVDSAGIRVAKKINTTLVTGFTLASGAITNTGSYSRLDTEGAVALDTLTTINGGTDGDLLILKITSGARDIFVQDGTGNLALAGGTGLLLGDVVDRIVLQYDGAATSWVEISRSDN